MKNVLQNLVAGRYGIVVKLPTYDKEIRCVIQQIHFDFPWPISTRVLTKGLQETYTEYEEAMSWGAGPGDEPVSFPVEKKRELRELQINPEWIVGFFEHEK